MQMREDGRQIGYIGMGRLRCQVVETTAQACPHLPRCCIAELSNPLWVPIPMLGSIVIMAADKM